MDATQVLSSTDSDLISTCGFMVYLIENSIVETSCYCLELTTVNNSSWLQVQICMNEFKSLSKTHVGPTVNPTGTISR